MDTVRYVAGLAFTHASVYLIRKKRPAWMAGKLNAIGGHIERDETPEQAMVREFQEETGLETKPGRWQHFCTLRGVDQDGAPFEVMFFRTNLIYPKQSQSPTDERVGLYNVRALLRGNHRTMANLRWLAGMAQPECQRDWPYHVEEKYHLCPVSS